jgi:hypothetical protein
VSDVDYLSDLPSSLRVYRWELRLAWAHVSRLLSWVARNARDALGRNESPGGGRQRDLGYAGHSAAVSRRSTYIHLRGPRGVIPVAKNWFD